MADDQVKFVLDLDTKNFMDGVSKSLSQIQELGSDKNLAGLISGLGEAASLVGVLGVAYLSLKGIADAVFDAEKIKAVNAQFEILTRNAGIVGDELKDALQKSSAGLIGNTELLKSANIALIEMGNNGNRLAEIMEIARKVTATMGGDLNTRFQEIAHAIGIGSERMLRQLGLQVNVNQAYIDYANKIGTVVTALTDQEKKSALLDAVNQKIQQSTKGINTEITEGINTWARFKVQITELREAISQLIEKVFGNFFRAALKEASATVKGLVEDFRLLTKVFGEHGEKSKTVLTEQDEHINKVAAAEARRRDAQEKDLKNLEARIKFEKELISIESQRIQAELQVATTSEQVDRLMMEKKEQEANAELLRLQEIRQQRMQGLITEEQAAQMREQISRESTAKMEQIDQQYNQEQMNAAQRRLEKETRVDQQIANSAEVQSRRVSDSWRKSGGIGGAAVGAFSTHAVSAFQAIGEGSQSATDIMRGAFFGMLADVAAQYGEFMLLSGLFPPNPPVMAAGAALLVLSGYLKSQAKGHSETGGYGGGGGGGGGGLGGASAVTQNMTNIQQSQQEKKIATIQVMGNYFETEETRNRLMELMRQATDFTDFKYVQIGQK